MSATPMTAIHTAPHPDDDTPARFAVHLGPLLVATFQAPAAADAFADALTSELATTEGVGACYQRAALLRSDADALDVVAGRSTSPRSAALAVLRWVLDGAAPAGLVATVGLINVRNRAAYRPCRHCGHAYAQDGLTLACGSGKPGLCPECGCPEATPDNGGAGATAGDDPATSPPLDRVLVDGGMVTAGE